MCRYVRGFSHRRSCLLREAGIQQPILLLEGCFCAEDLQVAAKDGFQTLIHHPEQLAALESTELEKPVKTWLKLDTGMHRLGVHAEDVAEYVSRLQACRNVDGEPRICQSFQLLCRQLGVNNYSGTVGTFPDDDRSICRRKNAGKFRWRFVLGLNLTLTTCEQELLFMVSPRMKPHR